MDLVASHRRVQERPARDGDERDGPRELRPHPDDPLQRHPHVSCFTKDTEWPEGLGFTLVGLVHPPDEVTF